MHFGAIYFALYTGILIISTMFLNGPEYLSDRIKDLKEKGITQREIALRLKVSESKVSRIIKRIKDA
jgi:DNA-binding MarR family transcriptional regulator